MPQFAPGVAKIAIAPIVAQPSGMSCEAELFLGPDAATKVVTSGRVPFVSTGVAKNVNLPITMPGSPGSYHGYIDVFAGGLRFLAYILTEDVTIAQPQYALSFGTPTGNIAPPTGMGGGWGLAAISCTVTNNNSVRVTRQIAVLYGTTPGAVASGDRIWVYQGSAWKTVTLDPGQSINLVQPREFIMPGVDPYTYGTSWNQPAFATPSTFYFKLVDDLGNASQVISLSR